MKAVDALARAKQNTDPPAEILVKIFDRIKNAVDKGYEGIRDLNVFKVTDREAYLLTLHLRDLGYYVRCEKRYAGPLLAYRKKIKLLTPYYDFEINWSGKQ